MTHSPAAASLEKLRKYVNVPKAEHYSMTIVEAKPAGLNSSIVNKAPLEMSNGSNPEAKRLRDRGQGIYSSFAEFSTFTPADSRRCSPLSLLFLIQLLRLLYLSVRCVPTGEPRTDPRAHAWRFDKQPFDELERCHRSQRQKAVIRLREAPFAGRPPLV